MSTSSLTSMCWKRPNTIILTEVVLAVMLRSFKFSLSDKDIYWNVGIVSYPTVGKVDTKGTMPLKLEVIRI